VVKQFVKEQSKIANSALLKAFSKNAVKILLAGGSVRKLELAAAVFTLGGVFQRQ
jgi:hypothetical protein